MSSGIASGSIPAALSLRLYEALRSSSSRECALVGMLLVDGMKVLQAWVIVSARGKRRTLPRLRPRGASADKPLAPATGARGGGAPEGATTSLRLPAGALELGARRLPALHRGFSVPGAVLPDADPGGFRLTRSGRLSPAFVRAASSHQRQSLVVGTDGDPRPPGSGGTFVPARRRRALLHLRNVSRRRPQ